MKKLLMLLCFSVVGVAVSAQAIPQNAQHSPQKKGAQKQVQLESFTNEIDGAVGPKGVFSKRLERHSFANLEAEITRQVAQGQMQQSATAASGENEIDHDNPATTVSSERPSYYATDDAYQTCQNVKVCEEWVRQQAQTEIHFQVLSASLLQKEDLHHQSLVVKYVKYQDTQEKVFDQDFDGWKEL